MSREKIVVELGTDGSVYTVDGKFIGHFPEQSEVYFFGIDADEFLEENGIIFVLEDNDEDEK